MLNNDVTILVNSCDKYEDAWEPFFRLLKRQWPECSYDIVLNTESKKYEDNELRVKTINTSKRLPWSARLKKVVRQIDSELIMFFLEDEFLRSPVNQKAFENAVQYMMDHKDVGYILMRHSEKQKTIFETPFFSRKEITDKFEIVGLSALYRKDFMLKLLRGHESPWEFERYATIRSKKYHYKILQYNNSFPIIFDYDDSISTGYGLTQGKWVKGTKKFLDSFGIKVDYDKLGWYDPNEKNINEKTQRWIVRKIQKYFEGIKIKLFSMR